MFGFVTTYRLCFYYSFVCLFLSLQLFKNVKTILSSLAESNQTTSWIWSMRYSLLTPGLNHHTVLPSNL